MNHCPAPSASRRSNLLSLPALAWILLTTFSFVPLAHAQVVSGTWHGHVSYQGYWIQNRNNWVRSVLYAPPPEQSPLSGHITYNLASATDNGIGGYFVVGMFTMGNTTSQSPFSMMVYVGNMGLYSGPPAGMPATTAFNMYFNPGVATPGIPLHVHVATDPLSTTGLGSGTLDEGFSTNPPIYGAFTDFVITSVDLDEVCHADLDDGSATGTPGGGVDINDLLFFLASFEAGSIAHADLDDGSGAGIPDGGVDINDLLFFLTHFESGC